MTKLNHVLRVVLTGIVIAQGSAAGLAHAGSIVINNPPAKKLSLQEENKTVELEMTADDVRISAGLKTWLDRRFGSQRGDYPYMIDKQTRTVTVLVDRAAGQYEVIPISQLKE
jgi:hypothetical protein